MLALVTGMRRGELLGLKWSDVNFAEGVISVRRSLVELKGEGIIESEPKTSKGYRSILLPAFALAVLKEHQIRQTGMRQRSPQWQDRDFVFCTSHSTPFAAANLRTMFKGVLKKAGLPDIRFHDLSIVWRRSHSVLVLIQSGAGVTWSWSYQFHHGHLLACSAHKSKRIDGEAQ